MSDMEAWNDQAATSKWMCTAIFASSFRQDFCACFVQAVKCCTKVVVSALLRWTRHPVLLRYEATSLVLFCGPNQVVTGVDVSCLPLYRSFASQLSCEKKKFFWCTLHTQWTIII